MDEIRCGCVGLDCKETVAVDPDIEQRLREDYGLIVVLTGHPLAETDEVLETRPGYYLVRVHNEVDLFEQVIG